MDSKEETGCLYLALAPFFTTSPSIASSFLNDMASNHYKVPLPFRVLSSSWAEKMTVESALRHCGGYRRHTNPNQFSAPQFISNSVKGKPEKSMLRLPSC